MTNSAEAKMGWKSVVGYAAGGVCAVVALPVFGAVGAVTAVGAVVGVGVGAAVGAVVGGDDNNSSEINAAEERGRNQAKAKHDLEMARLEASYLEATQEFQKVGEFYKLVEALFTVGMACARECGRDSDNDIETLMEFIVGLSHRELPQRVTDKLQSVKAKPPTLHTAYNRAVKLAPNSLDLLDQVADLAAHGIEGKDCRDHWAELRAA